MTETTDCVFCKIAAGQIPSHRLFEDADCFSFLDISPLAEGHTLLVPKRHFQSLADVPEDLLGRTFMALPRLVRAVTAATEAEGCNVLVNDGRVAGQVVPHVHIHVIPRLKGDSLGYRWNTGAYPEGRAEELCARIGQGLQ
ncbi:MAG: HIT family protein [Phycisphaerales bacterium]|nr:MAG: HIT family protein [Phycisphaerales bacterium]